MRLAAAALLMVLAAIAQSAAGPAFEAATVKPNRSGSGNSSINGSPGRVVAENNTLASLIVWGFGIRDYQLSGPGWLENERYDVNAKLPAGASRALIPAMVRTLLIERFRLEFHHERKTMPALALVVDRKGTKLTVKGQGPAGTTAGRGLFQGLNLPVSGLAEHLSTVLGRPVLDLTKLKDGYDFTLRWVPDGAPADAPPGPSLPTALREQLGLRLESRKAPIEVLVIDRAERMPVK